MEEEKKKKERGREAATFGWRDTEWRRERGAGRANVSIKPACGIMAESNRLRCVGQKKKRERKK